MKKLRRALILFIIITIAFLSTTVRAQNISNITAGKVEYTEEYKNWLNLPEEEKQKQLEPRKYNIQTKKSNIINNTNNIFRIRNMLKASTDTDYTLKDVIPENMKVKNQRQTNSCWAFGALGALETNLAMLDKRNQNTTTVYDFSERHMVYASSRTAFLNDQINENGYNILPSEGGNFYLAQSYLTNGSGAISEKQMLFENNEENIDISKILNKKVITTLYDTIEFEKPSSTEKAATIEKMKTHISNYGGLFAGIHGASGVDSEYYNNDTGALYCDNSIWAPMNHAVIIVGWDDKYSKGNFVSTCQPQNDGAWIIRNSWGEKDVIVVAEFKEDIFKEYEDDFKQQGINSASEIPDEAVIEFLEENGYTRQEDGTYSLKIGNDGYMYVSYEDVNIYNTLWGVQKSKAEKDYDNIYQNDILGISNALQFYSSNVSKYYLANAFKREITESESLDRISVYTMQDYNNCKVYVNPNGTGKSKADLQEVSLKVGENIDLAPGYHTIEFEEPVELTGNNFVVVLEVEADGYFIMTMESNFNNTWWGTAEVNANESFFTTDIDLENNMWEDTATWTKADFNDTSSDTKDQDYQGNVNIKAYTVATTGDNDNNDDGNKEENNGEQEEETKRQPTPSKFEEAKAAIVDAHISVDDNDNSETNMTIKVSDIEIGNEENKYTYYYCLSENTDGETIKDEYWIEIPSEKITKENDGTYSITIYIDENTLTNFEEIENVENLRLFIKEIAEIDGNKIETVNNLKITLDVDLDIDNNNDNNNNDDNKQKKEENKKDETIAEKVLPFAGKFSIVLAIIGIILVGSFTYFRYKNIDK